MVANGDLSSLLLCAAAAILQYCKEMAASWCVSPLLLGITAAITLAALALQALRQRKSVLRLPPGPKGLPILGNWLLFPGGAITPKSLLNVSRKYGDLCLVKLGRCNVVIVSSPDMAREVLQTCGLEFGSRSRSFITELTSAHGQDMLFSDYGTHWRKMRRITTPPFFSTEALRRGVPMWEEEIDAAIADIASAASNKDKARGPVGVRDHQVQEGLASMNTETASILEGKDVRSSRIARAHDATALSSTASLSPLTSSVKTLPRGFVIASKPVVLAGNSMASPASAHGKLLSNGSADIVRRRLHLALYNMIYRMTFDRRFESMDDAIYEKLDKLNKRNGMLSQSFRFNVADFFPPLRVFFRSFIREMREVNHGRLRMFRDVFIKEHSEKPPAEKRRAGIDFLLDAEARGEITMKTVLLLFQNINVGALGTMSTVAKWGIIELINHPKVQKKLHEELESTLGKGGYLTHKDISNLPYLQAVVKEVLRMHMSVPSLVPHMNEHQENIEGYDIPPNSRILVNAWGIANDHRFWDNPEEFFPERFMTEKIDVYGSDYRLLPFGSGRRGCPGARMAFTVLALIFGKLVQAFELLPPLGVEKVIGIEVIGQVATIIINHLTTILKPRENASV